MADRVVDLSFEALQQIITRAIVSAESKLQTNPSIAASPLAQMVQKQSGELAGNLVSVSATPTTQRIGSSGSPADLSTPVLVQSAQTSNSLLQQVVTKLSELVSVIRITQNPVKSQPAASGGGDLFQGLVSKIGTALSQVVGSVGSSTASKAASGDVKGALIQLAVQQALAKVTSSLGGESSRSQSGQPRLVQAEGGGTPPNIPPQLPAPSAGGRSVSPGNLVPVQGQSSGNKAVGDWILVALFRVLSKLQGTMESGRGGGGSGRGMDYAADFGPMLGLPPALSQPREKSFWKRYNPFHLMAAAFGRTDETLKDVNRAFDDPDALIERGRHTRGLIGGTGRIVAGHTIKALKDPNELTAAGSGIRAVGEAGGAIPVIGAPIRAFSKLTETVIKSVDRLGKWSDMLHQTNMQFAEFSGAMAGVAAEQMVRDINLSQERGDRRAQSARQLAEARSRFQRAFAPLEDQVGVARNRIVSNVLDAVSGALGPAANWLADRLGQILGQGQQGEAPNVNANQWMFELARDRWRGAGLPPRFADGNEIFPFGDNLEGR